MRRSEIHESPTSRGWLAEIDPALASAVGQAGRTLDLRPGELLYHPDDNPGGMFGVVSGGILMATSGARRPALAGHIARRCHWSGDGSVLEKTAAQHDHVGQRADGAAACASGRT